MTINNINATTFRNKFLNIFGNCPVYEKIKQLIFDFANDPGNEKCHNFLWLLTYDSAKALNVWGLDEGNFSNLNPRDAWARVLRDELRFQRCLIHKDFLEVVNLPENCKASYQALLKATDKVVALAVYNACSERCICAATGDIEVSLYLLHSEKENNFFGGIRSLHFSYNEAVYLKDYHNMIGDLLECLWYTEKARRESSANKPLSMALEPLLKNGSCEEIASEAESTPSDEVDAVCEQDQVSSPDKTRKEAIEYFKKYCGSKEVASSPTTFKAVTSVNVLTDKTLFEKFFGVCQELKDAGYCVQMVLDKMSVISKIFEASNLLDG